MTIGHLVTISNITNILWIMCGIIMGTKERRRRERKQREDEIINAAEELFFSNGFDQTTLEQVAEKIELSKAALYRYFTIGKQELYIAILTRGIKIMNDMFVTAICSKKTGWDKIRAIGEAFFEFCEKYPGYRQFLFDQETKAPVSIFEKDETNEKAKEPEKEEEKITKSDKVEKLKKKNPHLRKWSEEGQRTGMLFFQVIMQGVADKSIRSDIQPEKLMMLLSQGSSGLIENLYRARSFIESIGLKPVDIVTLFYDLLGEALHPR